MRGFKRRVQHFNIALFAQVLEPVAEEQVHLLLKQYLLNARGHLVERWNRITGGVPRQQGFAVVRRDRLLRDLNALPKALFDEAQNLKPIAQIAFDPLRREAAIGEESLPSGLGGAVLANASGQLPANLRQPRGHLGLRRFDGLGILLADLLLDEGAGDQLLQGAWGRENVAAGVGGVENGQPHLLLQIAGQDGLVVDSGDYSVKYGGGG